MRDYGDLMCRRILMLPFLSGYIERMLNHMESEGYLLQQVQDSYNYTIRFAFLRGKPQKRSFYAYVSPVRRGFPYDNYEQNLIVSTYCSTPYSKGPYLYVAPIQEVWKQEVLVYMLKRTKTLIRRYLLITVMIFAAGIGTYLLATPKTEERRVIVTLMIAVIIIVIYGFVALGFLLYDRSRIKRSL